MSKEEKGGTVSEVLDLTHDQHSAFKLEFDDHEWKNHIKSLKPLGKVAALTAPMLRLTRIYYIHIFRSAKKILRSSNSGKHMLSVDTGTLRKVLWACNCRRYVR